MKEVKTPKKPLIYLLWNRTADHPAVQSTGHSHALPAPGGGSGLRHLHGHDRRKEHWHGTGGGLPDPVYGQGRNHSL